MYQDAKQNFGICHEVDTWHKISIYGMPIIGMPGDNNWVMLITGSLHYHSASKCSVYPFIVTYSNCWLLFQIDLVLSFEEILESLGIRHRFTIEKSNGNYPNCPVTLLPRWFNRGTSDFELVFPAEHEKGRRTKVRKWIARLYANLLIREEYSTSGLSISDAIKPPPVGTFSSHTMCVQT